MLSTSHPTPAHRALADSDRAAHPPYPLVPDVDSAARVRFYHTGEVSVRGTHVLAFCSTIASPGLQPLARQVRRLSVDFADVRPARAGLELLADALAATPALDELTLLGMPAPDADGWVLRRASFRLRAFATDLALTSTDVRDFLRAQPDLATLGAHAHAPPPPGAPSTKSAYHQHMPFPPTLAPRLRTLDCAAPFLLALQAAAPPTRPLANLRVDLNRLNPSVESEALRALAAFGSTVRRLSLRRSAPRQSPALDRSGALSMASVVGRLAENRRWSRLRFLEMHDGTYDAAAIPGLSQSISQCCPAVETVVWAPSSHPAGSTASAACIAIIFFTFCRHLRHFIFLDDASDPANKRYVSVAKQAGGELRAVPIGAAEVEAMWRQEESSA